MSNALYLSPKPLARTEFQAKWIDRCLNENAIDPDVFEANVRFIEGQDVYESLNWTIPKQRGFGGLSSWNEGAGFFGEDGQAWQVRLDVPRVSKDGKIVKYESVRGQGARLFYPSVPPKTRELISQKWGVNVPENGSFWAWFNASKDARAIPLFPTEGGTKALGLLSHGFVSLSLYGVNSAWQKKESKYDRRELLPMLRESVRGRAVYFTFDSDVKPTAQIRVRQSIALIGKAIHKKLSPDVRVLQWDSADGKGADDFLSAQGAGAFNAIVQGAPKFTDWKKSSLQDWARDTYRVYSARAKADYQAIAPTVTDCGFRLPELGEAMLFDAPMGSGKTHAFGGVIDALRRDYPDMLVDAIGHRNNLLLQTATRLGLTHIHETSAGQHTQLRIDHEASLAYCADSLWRRFDALIVAMHGGQKLLLILDEVDALLKHILLSKTIKSTKRIHLIRKFSALLQAIGQGGGWIIGGEAALTQLAVNSLRELSLGKLRVTVASNRIKPPQWECFSKEGFRINGDGQSVQASSKQLTMKVLSQDLAEGRRVALLTTSQEAAEQFDHHFSKLGIKVWRLDSKTSPEKENRSAFQDMAGFIRSSDAQLFILTPTVESGVSIDGSGLVDRIVLYAAGLEPSTSYQLLGRFRDPSIPRILCVEEQGFSSTKSGQFDPALILESWRNNAEKVMGQHSLMGEVDPVLRVAHEIAAKFEARKAAGISGLRENLLDKLKAEGHLVVHREEEVDGRVSELVRQAKEAVEDTRCEDWRNADDSMLTPEQATDRMKDSDLTWLDRVVCLKAIERGKFGELVDQDSWFQAYWRNDRSGRALKNAVLTSTEFQNDGMATEADRMALSRQIRTTGTIWGGGFEGRDSVIETLKKLNLHLLLPIADTGTPIHADHHVVRSVFNSALSIVDEVSDVLNLNICPESRPMSFVKDLLEKHLGYEFEVERVRVPKPIAPPAEEAEEFLSHQNPHKNNYGEFSDSKTPDSPETQSNPKSPNKGGRPKKGETIQIRVYRLKSAQNHAEMVEAFKTAHDKSAQEFAESPEAGAESKLQPGRAINWGGEPWTVVAVRSGLVYLSEGSGVSSLEMCPRIPIAMVLTGE